MTVLVVGNFPPVPGPVTSATIDAVRRAAAAGETVRTASARPSGAELVVAVTGVRAGARLDAARRHSGADEVVLALADGVPARAARRPGARGLLDAATALAGVLGTALALRRFARVTLLVAGDPGLPARLWRLLWPVADRVEVVDAALAGALGVPARLLAAVPAPAPMRGLVAEAAGPGDEATTLGPPEVKARLMPRYVAGRVARRLLGPAFVPTWAVVRRVGRPVVRRLRARRATAA